MNKLLLLWEQSGTVSKQTENFIQRIVGDIRVEHFQKTTLQRTAQILRKVLENYSW